MRAPYQVAVLPYRKNVSQWEYALFRRTVEGYWQSIAGGGETNESPLEAAKREAYEEANIPVSAIYLMLATLTFVPVYHFEAQRFWGKSLLVIPVYYFAVDASLVEISLSHEHTIFQWVNYETGQNMLHWDSDKTALWEIDQLLCGQQVE
jgi:dATP pyrophosphohydrolase